jgi:hypothetical protein
MHQLKTLLTTILFSLIASALCAQAELCDNCYIWEFTTDSGERDQTTRLLSNDIEDILSQYQDCKVLQRSRYAKLQEQINNEKAIQSLSGANAQIKTELKTIQAKRVIFGSVNRDFQGNVALRLSFENLQTSQVKSNTVFLTGDDYYNFEKRKLKLTAFINSFVNPDGKLPTPTQSRGTTTASIQECSRDNMPFQQENTDYQIKAELCQCYFYNKKITCPFIIKNISNNILGFGMDVSHFQTTRIIIDYGKDYLASSGKLMSYSSQGKIDVQLPVTKYGVPGQLVFDVPETKSKVIESFEIGFGYYQRFIFPDVPLVHGPPPAR